MGSGWTYKVRNINRSTGITRLLIGLVEGTQPFNEVDPFIKRAVSAHLQHGTSMTDLTIT